MIKYIAFVIGKEREAKYFNTAREAFDYIKSIGVPLEQCVVELVEIPE